jgi:hypothetical protein
MTRPDRPDDPTVPIADRDAYGDYEHYEDEPEDGRRRIWRDVFAGLIGALFGFVIALVVVALATSPPEPVATAELAAAQERIAELEAQLAERDAQLAEAEAAAAERDVDVEAQRQALDERATALDERARALDEREAAVEQREAQVAERERAADDPDAPQVPAVDDETVDNIVERVIDYFRDLFGGGN